jgi:hypothetical protein
MSDNLNDLIRKIKLKKESSQSSDLNKSLDQQQQKDYFNESFSPTSATKPLDENSSTAEFRKYLDDLKKSYLEKLTFSCPSKLLSNSLNLAEVKKSKMIMENKNDIGHSLRSSENIHNLLLNNNNNKPTQFSDNSTVRRSLLYDYNKNDSLLVGNKTDNLYSKSNMNISSINKQINKDNLTSLFDDKENINDSTHKNNNSTFQLTPDLSKTQMLSRLVQIREYLKQAYTMLATLQTSNDLTNYASQMNKLHSLIDHLKDQEKGYMDLLESFHELTSSLSMNGVTNVVSNSTDNCQKDVLDISELNESATQLNSKMNKSLNESKNNNTTSGYSSLAKKSLNTDDFTSLNTNRSSNDSNSISGSFISDTLTLNNCTSTNQNNNIVKYNSKKNSASLNKSNFDDERTDNDQDDDDYENEFDLKEKQNSIREQRQEIFKELDKDLVQLEQLREQKQLLRSIRLRKEELKALEGRRKALEALKKIAVDGENELDDAFNVLDKKEIPSSTYSSTDEINKLKELEEFNSFLTMLKKETKDDNETETENESESNKTATLTRKTAAIKLNSNNNNYEDESDDNFKIEPSTQIEKSKKQIKHFEEIMSRNSNNNSLSYNPVNDEENNANNDNIEQYDEYSQKKELNERLASLAENEKKLE